MRESEENDVKENKEIYTKPAANVVVIQPRDVVSGSDNYTPPHVFTF